jgi:periplasmic divalent cation tolerance protein
MSDPLPPDTVLLVTTNAPDADTARRIATALVEQKLAACVNVGAPMLSVYRWQGVVEEATELPMWIKTTAGRRDALVAALTGLHPYEVPEVLVTPVHDGLPAYLDWIREMTRA